eukprot:2961748-Rhodomonas_salina.1
MGCSESSVLACSTRHGLSTASTSTAERGPDRKRVFGGDAQGVYVEEAQLGQARVLVQQNLVAAYRIRQYRSAMAVPDTIGYVWTPEQTSRRPARGQYLICVGAYARSVPGHRIARA